MTSVSMPQVPDFNFKNPAPEPFAEEVIFVLSVEAVEVDAQEDAQGLTTRRFVINHAYAFHEFVEKAVAKAKGTAVSKNVAGGAFPTVPDEKIVTKSLECLFCLRKFQCNAHLEEHMSVHTGERPFWCGVCGQEFGQLGTLKIHQRTHTGEKPHQCKLCPKRFTTSSNLRCHGRTHSGEKPWKCPDCGKAYLEKSGLNKHRRAVHKKENAL